MRADGSTEDLCELPLASSLGAYYGDVVAHLGYRMFDEYKVMGLAPYGTPETYRDLFQHFYDLCDDGTIRVHFDRIDTTLFFLSTPRRKGEDFTQVHMDIAAALQESFERMLLHLVGHFQEKTGVKDLCLAGGAAHNCTSTGRLLYSGLFQRVFVQPAAHDAGTALGAALAVERGEVKNREFSRLRNVFWGTEIRSEAVATELARWKDFVSFERRDGDTVEVAADLLAEGEVLGWVQGRSEFGPRALGSRSIIADPRPVENKTRINAMVKKREGYRPFAPSVLEEKAWEYFEKPPTQADLSFMSYALRVREEKRSVLGAITHVDGSARVQTVSQGENPKYWDLISAFERRTGVAMVLNTSFNNNFEPIVDSPEDAIVAYLTTKLDKLVIDDFIVRRKQVDDETYLAMIPSLPAYVVTEGTSVEGPSGRSVVYRVSLTFDSGHWDLSEAAHRVMLAANGRTSLRAIIGREGSDSALLSELLELWSNRLLFLRPAVN